MPKQLSAADRQFLKQVYQAAYANPFGSRRAALDETLAEHADPDTQIERISARVGKAIARLLPNKAKSMDAYTEQDRQLLNHAVLFFTFHRHVADFDRHINLETGAPETRQRFDAAKELLATLTDYGSTLARAHRTIELFYQLRRGFRFIGSALIGQAPVMAELRVALWNTVFTHDVYVYESILWNRMEDFSTLLIGATGTGKSSAAAAIGRSGFIAYQPKTQTFATSVNEGFIPVNLSETPETLIESELFGHAKGAFTGASQSRRGLLSLSHAHGVTFLDEIGELPNTTQVKLLRVLEERSFNPVGSFDSVRFNGRVVAATHRDLPAMLESGAFRDDFYYRLCSDTIKLPTLRSQLDAEPSLLRDLIHHLLKRIVDDDDPSLADSIATTIVAERGATYAWPGNVRELSQSIRSVLLTDQCAPSMHAPKRAELDPQYAEVASQLQQTGLSADALTERYCQLAYQELRSYAAVASKLNLDPRTVRKYVVRQASTT